MTISVQREANAAVIWIDNPPVNAMSVAVRAGLADTLRRLSRDEGIAAVVLASRQRSFIAGADVKEFDRPPMDPSLREVVQALDTFPVPLVAAIDGAALGGGLEIALACDIRIVTVSARLGLPESKLGIMPGAGGTQRLPRAMPPADAAKMILDGTVLTGEDAVASGLALRLVGRDTLIPEAIAAGVAIGASGRRRLRDVVPLPETRQSFEAWVSGLGRRIEDPQVKSIVDAVRATFTDDFDTGLALERRGFELLLASDRAKALRYAFFAERGARATPAALDVNSVGVVGGGTMGAGIAIAVANAGLPVTILETDQAAADRAMERVATTVRRSAARSRPDPRAAEDTIALVRSATCFSAFADVDLVLEAAFEEMAVKKDVFESLATAVASTSAVLATNTSYLDVDAIADFSGDAGRVAGMHFFSPANVMKLVEVVRGGKSSDQTIDTIVKLARRLGKIPVVVENCHGFVGNRMLARRSEQLDRVLLEGASPEQVDAAMVGFGFKMGPCATGDLAGLDISWRMRRATGREAPAADALVEAGRLGQKTGRGYFSYSGDGRTPEPDQETLAIISAASDKSGLQRRAVTADEITDRLLLSMVNEGARILEEAISDRASDIDVIWLNGYGFPRHLGGPMFYADLRGLPEVVCRLERLREETGDPTFAPAALLKSLAEKGARVSSFKNNAAGIR